MMNLERQDVEDLAAVPVAAVVLHGRGHEALDHFQRYVAAHALAQARTALKVARHLGVDSGLVAQAGDVLDVLLEEPLEELLKVTASIAFQSWLTAIESRLFQANQAEELARLLAHLPYLLMPSLQRLEDERSWRVCLPVETCMAPLGLPFTVDGGSASDDDLQMTARGGQIQIEGSGGCRLMIAFDAAGRPSLEEAHAVSLRPRRFSISGVELFSLQDFPQLQPFNAQADQVQASRAAEVDRHLAGAFDFLIRVWPDAIPDIVSTFRGVVALETPQGTTFSASTPAVPRLIQLTIRPDESPEVLAECIVHEIAHVKLDLLWSLHPLLTNDAEPRYRHPWRRDLRPMRGVLLGAHAFLNVAEMNQRGAATAPLDAFMQQEMEKRRREVREAMRVLERDALFTPLGRQIYDQMTEVAGAWGSP
jgi:HEXXH motif-containing protein